MCDLAPPDSAKSSLMPETHLVVQVSMPFSQLDAKILVAHCRVHNRRRAGGYSRSGSELAKVPRL